MAKGATFFLLADSSFTPDEEATLRLEGAAQALQRYEGIDILLYRINDPLDFLRRQSNLHRVQQPGRYDGEGLSNALHYVWDHWYKKSRLAWQRLFSAEARAQVVTQVPLLSQAPPHSYVTEFADHPQYQPISGLPLLHRFRYPLWEAEPIPAAGAGIELQGSSHNISEKRPGNVRLPLGKLAPGLYLVEGLLGKFRATTLLFVADTLAISKTSGQQTVVWTADKRTGQAIPGVRLLLGDGTGILEESKSDSDGIATFSRPSPERAYLLGVDQNGGVVVAENIYFDSEIHSAHLYAFTDRPLYRPGDTVRFKLLGRHFQQANQSQPLQAGPIPLLVLDAQGHPVQSTTFHLDPQTGGDGQFQLPDQAPAGGYTLRFTYQNEPYTASFRVASFSKPHYELEILFDQESYQSGQSVHGTIRALQPGGQPIKALNLELNLRSQAQSYAQNEANSPGRFPILLQNRVLQSDDNGKARFSLPAANTPSLYYLRVVGSDGSSSRVSTQKTIRIEAATPHYLVHSARQLSQPGESIAFTVQRLPSPAGEAVRWSATRLEDQSKQQGTIQGEQFSIRFSEPGSYAIQLLDAQESVIGSGNHWVSGNGLQAPTGSIVIHSDRQRYQVGQSVQMLITFPAPVREALLTLEQEQVHQVALLSKGAAWLRRQRINDQQWLVEIPIDAQMQPQRVFSVLMIEKGSFLFQNKGIRIDNEPIAIALHSDRERYQPGETVQVEVTTHQGEQPVAAHLTVSVVDEAVYLLQTELAPDIRDFFGHWRRNQVRTSSSLQFYTYDQAVTASKTEGESRFRRPSKLLQRPRRENIDTALWLPHLATDSSGKAHFRFTLPDAVTRWRITARATTSNGLVGQQTAPLVADKAAYLKWSAPTRFRQGDRVQGILTAYNNRSTPLQVQLRLQTAGDKLQRSLTLQPGSNPLPLPLTIDKESTVHAALLADGAMIDQLEIPITLLPHTASSSEQLILPLKGETTPLTLPANAQEVQVFLGNTGSQQWWRLASDLIDYPYGCAEQTASRLLPLTMAYQALRHNGAPAEQLQPLRNRIANQRLRLAQMAGPEAGFAWWGDQGKGSPFFTAYAYAAEARALQALAITVPANHWYKLLDTIRKGMAEEPLLLQALTLWFAQDLGLPIQNMAQGVAKKLLKQTKPTLYGSGKAGMVLGNPESGEALDVSVLLLDLLLNQPSASLPELHKAAELALPRMEKEGSVLAQALRLYHKNRFASQQTPPSDLLADLLAQVAADSPTIDRAITLLLLERWLAPEPSSTPQIALQAPWLRTEKLPGHYSWIWPQKAGALPHTLQLHQTPPPSWQAQVRYQRPSGGKPTLPITITRRLYRLTPLTDRPTPDYYSDNPIETLFSAQPVAADQPLSAQDLYLDQIILESKGGTYRYGLLEVPLPPGGEREPFTWGMAVTGLTKDEQPLMLSESRAENRAESYIVPIPVLGSSTAAAEKRILHHLIRMPLQGSLQVPAVRYFSMYNPEAWASSKQGMRLSVR